jgi:acetyl-CoA decarbonylase/synthase complex subunit epsilon
MWNAEPWQKAEIPGPTRAQVVVKPEILVTMIEKAKRPMIVIGHEAVEIRVGENTPLDYAIRISEINKIPSVATGHVVIEFIKRNRRPTAFMSAIDIANRLVDSAWKGLDDKGQYDLVMFIGYPYQLGWILFSSIKNFNHNIQTISLDRYYHPNASFSFPNLSVENWARSLEAVINKLEGGLENIPVQ